MTPVRSYCSPALPASPFITTPYSDVHWDLNGLTTSLFPWPFDEKRLKPVSYFYRLDCRQGGRSPSEVNLPAPRASLIR